MATKWFRGFPGHGTSITAHTKRETRGFAIACSLACNGTAGLSLTLPHPGWQSLISRFRIKLHLKKGADAAAGQLNAEHPVVQEQSERQLS
jgi:hypothetical protein